VAALAAGGRQALRRGRAVERKRERLRLLPEPPARVRAVAKSPHLAGLRVLNLCSCEIDDEMAVELARSP
jgi:hypothetical protein